MIYALLAISVFAMLGTGCSKKAEQKSETTKSAVQTESALTSIKVCFVWIPILVYACGLVIMKFYHLDKEFDGIIADLKARAQK